MTRLGWAVIDVLCELTSFRFLAGVLAGVVLQGWLFQYAMETAFP